MDAIWKVAFPFNHDASSAIALVKQALTSPSVGSETSSDQSTWRSLGDRKLSLKRTSSHRAMPLTEQAQLNSPTLTECPTPTPTRPKFATQPWKRTRENLTDCKCLGSEPMVVQTRPQALVADRQRRNTAPGEAIRSPNTLRTLRAYSKVMDRYQLRFWAYRVNRKKSVKGTYNLQLHCKGLGRLGITADSIQPSNTFQV